MEPRRIDAIVARFEEAGRAGVLVDREQRDRIGFESIEGVVLGNEVLDALPVHRVVVRDGRLREVLVGSRTGAFVDVEAEPSTPGIAARFSAPGMTLAGGVTLAEGQRAEVCLALDPWMVEVAAGLRRGALLLIDHGYPATELYDPIRRREGTLRAYLRHRVHDDPYIHVGRQDLTAHVDVTAVERAAASAGLTHLGTTTQAEFLVGVGIPDLLQSIQADPATTLEGYLTVRSALTRMLDPGAMGRFRVMGFGRDWPDGPNWPDGPDGVDGAPKAPLASFAYRLRR